MKAFRIVTKIIAILLTVLTAAVFLAIFFVDRQLSESYYIVEGKQLNVNCQIPITYEAYGTEHSQSSLVKGSDKTSYDVNFKVLGLFPVKSASVSVIDNMAVNLLGMPFGIKIYTDGVLVVDMADVDTEKGSINPAKAAGIKVGDTIKSINGKNVYSNEDVSRIIEGSDGSALNLLLVRDGKKKNVTLKPEYSLSAGAYRIGIWVRDSTAGIGTLTFYSPATDILCGLGHGVCDEDTGEIMNISSGEIVSADIVSLKKGEKGQPGELKGRLGDTLLGNLLMNCESGVYAENVRSFDRSSLVSIALKQEIKEGQAYIYTTVDGDEPEYYSCEIKVYSEHEKEPTQNLIVTVTDPRLIEKTGGIVQGMSGSPIVQDGKLIGAVTHVFINNPQKGYGIFAENMLKTARNVESEQLKTAS